MSKGDIIVFNEVVAVIRMFSMPNADSSNTTLVPVDVRSGFVSYKGVLSVISSDRK